VPLPPGRFGDVDEAEAQPREPVAVPSPHATAAVSSRSGPGSLARLISVIISVGLAWALVVAITAWVLGLFLARG
ncbi:MAG: hypothetical protein L0221_13055, partial [Chloroflexi bacterium]|nr:hypothetical protein [Chloroflexota bacterium]